MKYTRIAMLLLGVGARASVAQGSATLRVESFGSGAQTFHVLSTLVSGPTEALLWDGQYHPSDGARIADSIAARGKQLRAIVLSHADHDHYQGVLAIVQRFPGTPIYAAASVRADFARRAADDLALEKRRRASDVPDSLPALQPLPSRLTIDGVALTVIDGLTGDVKAPASSVLWIPSIQTALVGDLAFSGIHPWLGDSDADSRERWRSDLRRIKALGPRTIVPGHQRDVAAPQGPALLDEMIAYLDTFDAAIQSASDFKSFMTRMTTAYPDRTLPGLMAAGARQKFAPPTPPSPTLLKRIRLPRRPATFIASASAPFPHTRPDPQASANRAAAAVRSPSRASRRPGAPAHA